MKKWSILKLSLILLLFFTFPIAEATYVKDGTILILRSQYTESDNEINIDGSIGEDAWSKAGSIELSFENPDTADIRILFTNTADHLYFAIQTTNLELEENDSLLITFDTDADGVLSTPEDAKYISALGALDYYWDGSNWVEDRLGSSNNDDFLYSSSVSENVHIYEFQIPLVAESVTYDGFRFATLSNSFVPFNIFYNESSSGVYQFPTNPSNATGYVDLKLAGPEDQDLPEYIPPEIVTDPDNGPHPVEDAIGTEAGALHFNIFIVFISIIPVVLIYHRRNYNE